MRRYTLIVAAVAASFLIGGCSGEPGAKGPDPAGPTASPDRPSRTPGTPPPGLDLPGNAQVLVPETTGDTDRDLPAFTPEEGVYTIYARCEGRGKVSIVRRDSSKPHPVACNDVLTVGLVYVEKKAQHIRIQVAGGTATWNVAVVSGNHQS
ncbi:hypothetical protein ABZ705_14085 [Streptomyces sp. NPDC006984]|uniref:hypothetical protein n=1 Tax=Streptomyces sp. NPDC006984 TaxID=3155463 RepID=UPI0033D0B9C7